MLKLRSGISIYDWNFIYIFCGFPFMTSLYANPSASIIYRAIGILISGICLIKQIGPGAKLTFGFNKYAKFIFCVLIVYTLVALWQLTLGEYAYEKHKGKIMALLFTFGVVWLPMVSLIWSLNRIHWTKSLTIMFFMLLFACAKGFIGTIGAEEGRMNLNESQGFLAFGDNSMWLSIISLSLLLRYKNYFRSHVFQYVLIGGFVLGVLCALKAGSRGPLLSGLCGIFFLAFSAEKHAKHLFYIVLLFSPVLIGGVLNAVKDYAPVMYERSRAAVEDGDTSGRDDIFSDALSELMENPVFPGKSIIIDGGGFFGYHNAYLSVALGTGIFFAIFYIYVLVSVLFKLIKNRKKLLWSPPQFYIAGMFIFFIIRGITGVNILSNCNYDVTMLCAAILATTPNRFCDNKNAIQYGQNYA